MRNTFIIDERIHQISGALNESEGQWKIVVDEVEQRIRVRSSTSGHYSIEVNGTLVELFTARSIQRFC